MKVTNEQIQYLSNLYTKSLQYLQDNQIEEAEKYSLELVRLVPDNSDILNLLGRLYQFKGKFDLSIEYLEKSIKSNPENILARYNLIFANVALKKLENSKKACYDYINCNVEHGNKNYVYLYISKLHFDLLHIEETKHYYNASNIPLFQQFSKLLIPRIYNSTEELMYHRNLYENTLDYLIKNYKKYQVTDEYLFLQYLGFTYCYGFPLSYQGISNRIIYKKQSQMFRLIYPQLNYTSKYIDNYKTKKSTDKINIGFISTNFFNQSVSRDRMGVIRNLPRDKFNVFIFYYFKPNDDLGRYIWESDNTNIVLPDSNFIDRRKVIEEQKLDVLVYCDIGMSPDTMFMAYTRLAPIQLNTWGHSDTSGIDTIDYFMSSNLYEEEWSQDNYTEKLVRLNSLCTYYFKIIENPDIVSKEYFGIDKNKKLYLCCQTLFKINPSYDILIKQLLDKDKNGIFAFIEMSVGKYIQEQLVKRLTKVLGDEDIKRVIFMKWHDEEFEFYKTLSCADVILDSYPFGGCNTSFSALGMGLPIISFPGKLINGRFTLGMYRKMGIHDLIVNTNEEYINKAYQVANDYEYRNNICKKILDNNHLLFNEVETIITWSNSIQQFYNNLINNNIPNNNILNNIPNNIPINNIPNIFHFVFFGYTKFEYIHYLSIKTCYDNNPDAIIYLYNTQEPKEYNINWNNMTKYVKIVKVQPPDNIYGNSLYSYAHKADIVRLQKLIEYGGIYLDIDVLTIRSFKDILSNPQKDCIMGFQASNTQYEGLCNAVIIAKPQSQFLINWLDNYKTFNSNEWDKHSVHLPKKLAQENPELIECYSQEKFFPISWWFPEKYKLFADNDKYLNLLNNSYCIHLWETKWKDTLNNINNDYMLNIYNLFTHTFKKYCNNNFKQEHIEELNQHYINNNYKQEHIEKLNQYYINNNYNYKQEYNDELNQSYSDIGLHKVKNILYIGSSGNSGYSISAKGYIKALLKMGHNIKFQSYREEFNTGNEQDDMMLKKLETNNIKYDIIICHTIPTFWNLFKEIGKLFIGVFVWETNNLPLEWIENIRNTDKIITPSKFNMELINKYNKNVFYVPHLIENIFVEPIKYNFDNKNNKLEHVFNNIYLEYGEPFQSCDNLINKDTYIFYTIGTFEVRKNIEQLIKVYSSLKLKNIILYIKTNLWKFCNIKKMLLKFNCIKHPIIFNFENVNMKNIYNIHYKGNCFISTSYSEGVGLSIVQAGLYKNQVIFNKFGGTIEYLPLSKNCMKYNLVEAFDNNNLLFNNNNQLWGQLTNEDINDIMINVYDDYKTGIYKEEVEKNYDYIKNNFNINKICHYFSNVFDNVYNIELECNKEKVKDVEILVIGDLSTLRTRMDKNIYNFLLYIKNFSKYNITFITPTTENFKIGMDIYDVVKTYCETDNPIIYSVVFDRIEKCIVGGLHNYKGKKIYELEDVYDINNILNCIKTYKYDYVLYKYNCEQQNIIINNTPETKYVRMIHYIDDYIFKLDKVDKTIDILLYGNISNFYPFRRRVFELIKNSKDINYYEIPFPGYGDEVNPSLNQPQITGKDLAQIINSSKFTICTCSSFNYLLKKYFESALCGSVIIGNIPDRDADIFDNNYINIDNTMTDEKILNIIKSSIDNYQSKYIQNIKNNMYEIVKQNYTYKFGCEKFDKFIDYINSN